jgi:hypothetical protein
MGNLLVTVFVRMNSGFVHFTARYRSAPALAEFGFFRYNEPDFDVSRTG